MEAEPKPKAWLVPVRVAGKEQTYVTQIRLTTDSPTSIPLYARADILELHCEAIRERIARETCRDTGRAEAECVIAALRKLEESNES